MDEEGIQFFFRFDTQPLPLNHTSIKRNNLSFKVWTIYGLEYIELIYCTSLCGRTLQTRRFQKRETDPLKQWKLSPIDKLAQAKWDDYTEAKEAMFFYTDTNDAPWMVIKSDDKKRARLNCMQYFLHSMPYPNKDRRIAKAPDPLIVGRASTVIDRDNHILGKSLHPDQQKAWIFRPW